jgi:flagellar FliJ protein
METLKALLEHAEAERNQALAAFNRARARCDASKLQAAQLDAYRADYRLRWSSQFARGAALEIVRCYQSFADRLEAAIAQQQQVMIQCHAAQTRASDTLSAHELRVASVRKLIERRLEAQRQANERRERREDDEGSTRSALARASIGLGRSGMRA